MRWSARYWSARSCRHRCVERVENALLLHVLVWTVNVFDVPASNRGRYLSLSLTAAPCCRTSSWQAMTEGYRYRTWLLWCRRRLCRCRTTAHCRTALSLHGKQSEIVEINEKQHSHDTDRLSVKLTCGISSFRHSVNLILFTVLLVHLILRISPHHSHHLRSHHLSLLRPFIPDLKLTCFTDPFLRSLSGSVWTAFTRIS